MASDATPVQIPATSPVHGSQAPTSFTSEPSSGKSLPSGGHAAAAGAASAASSAGRSRTNDVQAQVAFLNKFLNDSGKPNQFRVAPDSNSALIQEINPSNGAVIADYPVIAFPALARSLGISSALIDERA
jgi:hypothetical protein